MLQKFTRVLPGGIALHKDGGSIFVDGHQRFRILPGDRREILMMQHIQFDGHHGVEGFNNKWRKPDEFREFLAGNDEKFGKLLKSEAFANISTGTIGPMMYPGLLFTLMAALLAALGLRRVLVREGKIADRTSLELKTVVLTLRVRGHHPEGDDYVAEQISSTGPEENAGGLLNLVFILTAVVAYLFFVESVGFVLLAGAMLFVLLLRLGTRFLTGIAVTLVFIPMVYHIFAHFLRVPLPRGFLGW